VTAARQTRDGGALPAPLLLAFLLAAALAAIGTGPARAATPRPNVVVILTDDQRADGADRMPVVQSALAAHGVKFTNAFVSNSLCCPSRATLLTGRYSHTTQVWSNRPPFGAWVAFRALGAERRTIAMTLRASGYRTAYVGKYLNGYVGTTVPPGWDDWRAFTWGWGYFRYRLNVNGRLVRYGDRPDEYSTDVLGRMAARFIRARRGSRQPFLLLFAPAAPHNPVVPAPRHADALPDLGNFDPPSVGEDLSDKPAYIRRSAHPSDWVVAEFRRRQYRTLLAVDEAVGRIVAALRATRKLRDTVVIFTSDNGVEWGEHGFPAARKSVPHEGSIRVPLIVRYGRLSRDRRTDAHLVTNADLAPTIGALARVDHRADGRSMVPLLQGREPRWRRAFLVENQGGETASAGIPTYCGVRTEHALYVVYATGERELYDLENDPFELENGAGNSSSGQTERRLLELTRLLCFPPPPGFHPRPFCTLTGTSGDDRLVGGLRDDFVCLAGGRDRVSTGAGSDTVDARARTVGSFAAVIFDPKQHGPGGGSIATGPGDDRVLALNGRLDLIRCGSGRDRVIADRFDAVSATCERVVRAH